MVHNTPRVRSSILELSAVGGEASEAIPVGSAEWYSWLQDHYTFYFETVDGTMAIYKEHRSGDWYVYHYHQRKLLAECLGKSEKLTLEYLNKEAAILVSTPEQPLYVCSNPEQETHMNTIKQDTSVLATKLYTPSVYSRLVPRPRLYELLDEGKQHKLILITAPAGFGKTTLMSEWLKSRAVNESPYAWISLDKSDNDLVRFLAYLIAALRSIHINIRTDFSDLLNPTQPSAQLEPVLTALINDISNAKLRDFALVLDNYHLIEVPSIHSALAFLLDYLPQNMHLVISTRINPPLPIARLRTQGQLTELHTADLQFTYEEVHAFLNQMGELNLVNCNVEELYKRTEGWIAGLQLAALSLRRQENPAASIRAFTGNHHYVLSYFSEEVLQRESQSVRRFLLKTSILKQLSGSLCEAITDQADGQAMLERLEQTNLFLFPVGNEKHWYRYHHLFREFLCYQLDRELSSLVPKLHRKASEWYEQHNLEVEAVDHALAGNDFDRASRLIERVASLMLVYYKGTTLLGWLEAVLSKYVKSWPRLRILYAWVLAFSNQMESAESCLSDVEQSVEAHRRSLTIPEPATSFGVMANDYSPAENSEIQDLPGVAAAIRAYCAAFQQNTSSAIDFAQQALESLSVDKKLLRCVVTLILGFAFWLNGDDSEACRYYAKASTISTVTGNIHLIMITKAALAKIHLIQGRLHLANEAFQQAVQAATQWHQMNASELLSTKGIVYVGMGKLFYEWHDLNIATDYLVQGIELCKQWETLAAGAIGVVEGYITLAEVKNTQGDMKQALHMLQQAEQYALRHRLPSWTRTLVVVHRARLSLEEENIEIPAPFAQKPRTNYVQEFEYTVHARILIHRGQSERALELLEQLMQAAERAGRIGSIIELLSLQGLAYQKQNQLLQAMKVLGRALMLAEPEGYVRLFVDEGEQMASLLERIIETRYKRPSFIQYTFSLDYVRKLLAALGKMETSTVSSTKYDLRKIASFVIDSLSHRELEILCYVINGMSNQEIAQQIVVAESTIKWHLSNIYNKLNVHNRAQLIVRTRNPGL